MTKSELLISLSEIIGDDPELVESIYQEYVHTTQQLLAQASSALETEDFASLRTSAHTLKGCAANVGDQVTSQLAHELQLAAQNGNIAVCHDLQPQLLAALQATSC